MCKIIGFEGNLSTSTPSWGFVALQIGDRVINSGTKRSCSKKRYKELAFEGYVSNFPEALTIEEIYKNNDLVILIDQEPPFQREGLVLTYQIKPIYFNVFDSLKSYYDYADYSIEIIYNKILFLKKLGKDIPYKLINRALILNSTNPRSLALFYYDSNSFLRDSKPEFEEEVDLDLFTKCIEELRP